MSAKTWMRQFDVVQAAGGRKSTRLPGTVELGESGLGALDSIAALLDAAMVTDPLNVAIGPASGFGDF